MIFTRISQDCEDVYISVILKCITQSTAAKQCVVSLLWYIKPLKWPTQKIRFHAWLLRPVVVKCRFLPTVTPSTNTVDQFNSQCLLYV